MARLRRRSHTATTTRYFLLLLFFFTSSLKHIAMLQAHAISALNALASELGGPSAAFSGFSNQVWGAAHDGIEGVMEEAEEDVEGLGVEEIDTLES